MKLKQNTLACLIAVSNAHFVDLNRPPLMNDDVSVVPLGSNQIPGYQSTTEGWYMVNNYNLNADTMTFTTTVGYKNGEFGAGNVIQTFMQFQDWAEPWNNVNLPDPKDYKADFMNVVCNLFNEQPMTHAIQLTCGTEVLAEIWDKPGYQDVRGLTTGYPSVQGDQSAAVGDTCSPKDWDFLSGTKSIRSKTSGSKAVCQYSRKVNSTTLKQIRSNDRFWYYTGFNRFDSNALNTQATAVGYSMLLKLRIAEGSISLMATGASLLIASTLF